MKYLFSEVGQQVVEALSFTRTLYAFDFDGTLAPIVKDPKHARIPSETARLIQTLARKAPAAIISGRSIADLRTRVKINGSLLIGNHGVEGLGVKKHAIAKSNSICRGWLKQLHQDWGVLKADVGTLIEDKSYSLALHYRNSRNKKKAKLELFTKIEKLRPAPRIILGKCVINLIPSGGPHKGIALLELMIKLDLNCAFYIGDDDTDEDVFSLPDSRIITVRVGQKKSSQAQFFLKRQTEMNRLLRLLIRANNEL
jgi:trehalose 6-phosphate phosphatase